MRDSDLRRSADSDSCHVGGWSLLERLEPSLAYYSIFRSSRLEVKTTMRGSKGKRIVINNRRNDKMLLATGMVAMAEAETEEAGGESDGSKAPTT